jgi:superkiller protein 3
MSRKSLVAQSLIASLLLSSLVAVPAPVMANDLVPSDDLVGGTSVFVFRGSSKKPQGGGGSARASRGGFGVAGPSKARIAAQLASARKKKAALAKERARLLLEKQKRERLARLKQSNVLAIKGETQLESGDFSGAITSFRESIKLNAKNTEAISGLSDALTARGIETAGDSNNEAALPYLNEAVKLDPKDAVAFLKIGEIHDSKGRNAEAIVNFEKAVTIDPEFTSVYLPLGLAHAEAKNYVQAEAYLSKAEAAGLATSEARLARADIFTKQGKTQDAIAMLDLIIKAEPNNASAVYQRAAALDKAGQKDQALAGYKRAVQIDPNFAPAWFEIGVASYNKGDYQEALTAYQNVARIQPDNYTAQANLASTYRQLQRYAEANAAYKAAEPGNTKNPDHYSEWGFCLGKTNEWDKAVARLLTARELSPTAVDNTNLGWAYYNAAKVDKKNGNEEAAKAKFELARTYLNTAVQQDPKLDAAYLNLGTTSNELGDHEKAVEALNTAIALHGDWVIAYNQLGLGYGGLNKLDLAIRALDTAVRIDENYIPGLYNLGAAQHANKDTKGAKKTQDRLKKLDNKLAIQLGKIIAGQVVNHILRRGAGSIPVPIPVPIRIPKFPFN